jgi:hypothetical protein
MSAHGAQTISASASPILIALCRATRKAASATLRASDEAQGSTRESISHAHTSFGVAHDIAAAPIRMLLHALSSQVKRNKKKVFFKQKTTN